MLAQVSAIHPDIGYRVDAIEVHENLAAGLTGIDEEMTAVEARSAIIVVAAVLAVAGIPGVRDRDDDPTLVVKGFLFCASHIAFDKTPTIDQRRVASDLRRWRERLRRSHVERSAEKGDCPDDEAVHSDLPKLTAGPHSACYFGVYLSGLNHGSNVWVINERDAIPMEQRIFARSALGYHHEDQGQ